MIQLAAASVIAGPILAAVVGVTDGDNFTARAEVWPGVFVVADVRIAGVDTPEMRGRCEAEKRAAVSAREFVVGLLRGRVVELHDVRRGKYAGRVVARVTVDGKSLAPQIIVTGHGRAYDGGKRGSWC